MFVCLLKLFFIYSPWEHQLTCSNYPSTTTSPSANINPITLETQNESSDSTNNKYVQAYSKDEVRLENNLNTLLMSQNKTELSVFKEHMLETSVSTSKSVTNTANESKPTYIVPLQESSSTTVPIDKLYEKNTVSTSALKAIADQESTDSLSEVKEVQIELIKPQTCTSSSLQIGRMTSNMVEQLKILENNADPCSSKDLQSDSHTAMLVKISLACQSVGDNRLDVEAHVFENVEAELSPTTEEYQEGMHFGDASKDAVHEYDIVDSKRNKCYVPPAPTPAPSMAPLAVLDVDTVEDDLFDENVQSVTPSLGKEEERRRRKKRNLEGKKKNTFNEKEKRNEIAGTSTQTYTNEMEHNAICPWEDE